MAEKVVTASAAKTGSMRYMYDIEDSIEEKVRKIAVNVYGADQVEWSSKAKKQINQLEELGYGNLPVCMAKTQYSLTDDPEKLGRPEGFSIHVKEFHASVGAGFLVALTGDVMTMPGLPKNPAALQMDVKDNGTITGLF